MVTCTFSGKQFSCSIQGYKDHPSMKQATAKKAITIICIFSPYLGTTGEKGGFWKYIWLYQLSWKCKLATVMSYKTDVSSVSPSSERMCTLLSPPTQHHSFFRNSHPIFFWKYKRIPQFLIQNNCFCSCISLFKLKQTNKKTFNYKVSRIVKQELGAEKRNKFLG